MSLSPEEICAAEKLHAFVRSYENHIRPSQRSFWLGLPFVLGVGFYLSITASTHEKGFVAFLIMLICMTVAGPVRFSQLKQRYQRDRALLEILERDHGDELPWVEVEKHLAEVSALEQELAKHPAAS